MKTKLLNNQFLMLFVIMAGIFISSCTKEEPTLVPETDLSANATLKNAVIDVVNCDLIAGQTINVGQVIYSHDATNVYVTYTTSGNWTLKELHVYVGNLAGLPRKNSALQIGHFPFAVENLIGATTYTFTIPIQGLTKDPAGYTIAAHAVVTNGTQEETAWSNCSELPIITLKTFFKDAVPDRLWACTEGEVYFPDLFPYATDYYCPYLGIQTYKKEAGLTYKLQGPVYPLPTGAGNVLVQEDSEGENLIITVVPDPSLILTRTYLFVGTLAQLDALATLPGGCVDYTKFPYNMLSETANNTHVFPPIPIQKNEISISFEALDPKMRWGWYSVYNF